MAVSSAGLRLKSDCSGMAQKQLTSKLQTRPLVRKGATKQQSRICLQKISWQKKNWSKVPDGRLTPGQTARLNVGRKLTSTSTSTRPTLSPSGQSSWLHNGDVLCFLWGTNWIYSYVCYVEESRPPLWPSGQSFCLQNGDVLCLLWGTNWIYMCYVEESRPPLWSSVPGYRFRGLVSTTGATRFSEK
jgi:hypothetical protein